jgi:hypothetical protein
LLLQRFVQLAGEPRDGFLLGGGLDEALTRL